MNVIGCSSPDRAWVPIGSCYLMSKEIPFSVKKAKSIFNNAMAEMDVYVDNIRRRFGVFNYAPYRTAYLPDSNYQIAQRTENSQELEVTTGRYFVSIYMKGTQDYVLKFTSTFTFSTH